MGLRVIDNRKHYSQTHRNNNNLNNSNNLNSSNTPKIPLLRTARAFLETVEKHMESIDGNHFFWQAYNELKDAVLAIDEQNGYKNNIVTFGER